MVFKAKAPNEKTPLYNEQKSSEEKKPVEASDITDDGAPAGFSNQVAVVLSFFGCALGMGNAWRFPRILARNTGKHGGGSFILVWIGFLMLWSIPMLLVEYGSGRYCRRGVVKVFHTLTGPRTVWAGLWITAVNVAIGCYLSVVMGWCIYYFIYMAAVPLPTTHTESTAIFNDFTVGSYWPILTQGAAVLLTVICLCKGVATIERANMVLTPVLMLLLIAVFIWSMTLSHAPKALKFLFTPDLASFRNPTLWLDAASQNAYDTCAGTGIFIAYAAYLTTDAPVVKYALFIPIANNMVSLICSMMTFSTSFTSLMTINPNITEGEIVRVLQDAGPGGTGITFIWFPVLFSTAGVAGRPLAVMFFFSLFCAALSSYIAYMEILIRSLQDYGLPRYFGIWVAGGINFVVGLGSSLSLDFLTNQDLTWGIGVLLNGLLLQGLVIMYGTSNFREHILNISGGNDWTVPKIWEYHIKFFAPVEASVLLIWWIVYSIVWDGALPWYTFSPESLVSVLIQWISVFFFLGLVNAILYKLRPKWFHADDSLQKSESSEHILQRMESKEKSKEEDIERHEKGIYHKISE